jgi:hypothetical protein
MKSNNEFKKGKVNLLDVCLDKFSYLEREYSFKVAKKKGVDNIEIVYQNGTTGVQILFDRRENQIYVMIYQLENGKLIENPIFLSYDTRVYGYDLDDILSQRIPGYSGTKMRSDCNGVLCVLENYAKMLRLHAADLLLGDFQLFPRLEKIVKNRKLY